MILEIIAAICGCGWLATLVTFFVSRRDNRKDELAKINKQLQRLEKDGVRTQLLLLMANYTEEDEHELLTCAEHYFSAEHLHANWYMTSKFNRFLVKNNIAKPNWFEE